MGTYTATTVPTQFVEAKGIRFAYRRWGKRSGLPLVFNQHFTGNLDNWDPAVLDGLAREREVIIFNNAGVASSTGEVPTTFAGMAKNAGAFIDGLGLTKVDLLGFSIGGMVAQQITLDRPELVGKLILVGTAPRNHDAGNGQGHITPETAAIFGATYDPPENLWLKVFFTDSDKSQAAGREFLKRYSSRTENRDAPINDKVVPAQIAAVGQWGTHPGERFAYLKSINQATLVVSGNHDVIVYTVNSLYLVQNMPNAKLCIPTPTMDLGTSIMRILFLKQIGFSMKATELLRSRLAPQPADVQMFWTYEKPWRFIPTGRCNRSDPKHVCALLGSLLSEIILKEPCLGDPSEYLGLLTLKPHEDSLMSLVKTPSDRKESRCPRLHPNKTRPSSWKRSTHSSTSVTT